MRHALRPLVFWPSLLAVLGIVAVSGAPAIAQEPGGPSIDASREAFLRDFARIGMNSPYEDALVLRILVQARGARRGLEVGSANGYGAIHMGIGFERNGGTLVTLDIDPRMVRQCQANVAEVDLERVVTCREGDALKLIPTLEGPFDFVFIDARKEDYLRYLQAVEPLLAPGAIVVAHNAVAFAGAMQDYLAHVATGGDYETVIMQTNDRDGMAVSYRKR